MVKELESDTLRKMSISELKKHAKNLKQAGYAIKGYSGLKDTNEDLKKLRKLIRHGQRAGVSKPSSPKKRVKSSTSEKKSKKKKSGCNPDFKNKTECIKHTSASAVSKMAEDCGLDTDEMNKNDQCVALFGMQDGPGKGIKSSNPYADDPDFKKLMKNTAPQLKEKAKKKKLVYIMEDGKKKSVSSTRKQSIAIALLELKKGKKVMVGEDITASSRRSPTPKKKTKKTPTPKKSSKKLAKTPVSYPKKKCAGVKYKKLMAMPLNELRKTLHSKGLKSGLPRSKQGIVDYLCATEENGRCDPVAGEWCDGEFICDASNSPGVCVSPSQTGHHSIDTWNYQDKKITGTVDAIAALKKALKPSKKSKKSKKVDLPDPWSVEGLIRKKLINQIALATGRPKSTYSDWSIDELRERLDGLEIETRMAIAKSKKQAEADERESKRTMINQIVEITGEKKSKYKKYSIDELIAILDDLDGDEGIDEYPSREVMIQTIIDATEGYTPSTFADWSDEDLYEQYMYIMEMEKEPTPRVPTPVPTPVSDDESSSDDEEEDEDEEEVPTLVPIPVPDDESSSDDEEEDEVPTLVPIPVSDDESSSDDEDEEEVPVKQAPTPVPTPVSDDESSSDDEEEDEDEEESSDDESSRPDEGVEIPDVESTLANVIAGGSKIGEVAKVQRGILKCLGLMSK